MLKTPGGDREMGEILALVLQHDEQAVLAAVELALEAGVPTANLHPEPVCTRAWSTGNSARSRRELTHSDLVILDELGYLPFSPFGGALALPSAEQALRSALAQLTPPISASASGPPGSATPR